MFRELDRTVAGSSFLFCKLLVSCLFAGTLCDVTSFSLKPGSQSLSGTSVYLLCILDKYTDIISIFESEDRTDTGSALSKCGETECRNLNENYHFTISGGNTVTVEITIKSLQRTNDQKWWTCRTADSNKERSESQFQLTVYTVPSSITLGGPTTTCNLGQDECSYTCTTDQCTYPSPIFNWLYILDAVNTAVVSHPTSSDHQTNTCQDNTKIYENTLTFSRFELSSGNMTKTARLQCYITFTGLSNTKRKSGVSQDITFAEKVSQVRIYDGNDELIGSTLTVINNEEKHIKCIPGNGNPTPTVQLFIGNTPVSMVSDFVFTPNNSHHNQQIYCVADNIPNNGVDDAVSNKPVLYVKVKIQFVYIEPAADTFLSVIENIPEAAVCKTSAGRPGSTIKWYKNNVLLTDGARTDFEITDNNLNATKSTRHVKVLRSDSGWTLSCTASNFEESQPILANNSKRFNILYPPEQMDLLLDGKPVVGPVISVIKGMPVTLKCVASSNPPISLFSWNINQIVGETLTIDGNIQNGKIVNCSARNKMTSTAGMIETGYGSISKEINVQYGAFIERIEVNSNTGSTWVFNETDRISIACYVDSNPDSTISLFQGTHRLTEKGESAVLVYNISSAQCSHTNEYTCKAENGITNVEQPAVKTVQINIKCSPRLADDTDPSVFAQENTSSVLSLTILAYPSPKEYDWKRYTSNRWEKLENSTSIRMTRASLQFNLTFVNVKPEDYGEYKLTVYTNGIPFKFAGALKFAGEQKPHTYQSDDGSTATPGIIGGVVGGFLLVCLIVAVICFLRRRNSFDDIKTKLFGKTSTALREEIQPQEAGYSYAAVEKPTGGSVVNIINNSNAETKPGGESTPASGYLYSEVNKSGKDSPMTIMQDNKASESIGVKNRAKKTKATPETTNEGPCYENPAVLIESDSKAKPQKKGKPVKQKDKKQVSQSHGDLQYVELSFSDTKKKGKKTKPAQSKAEERTVYDAVQFGVVGAAYMGNDDENDRKK